MSQGSLTRQLIQPYGGHLIDLQTPPEERPVLARSAEELVSVQSLRNEEDLFRSNVCFGLQLVFGRKRRAGPGRTC
jgi:hypothetical protein